MIAQRNEKIKEQLTTSSLHFQLHGPAALECVPASDYEGEVVGSQLGVGVGCVGIGIAG